MSVEKLVGAMDKLLKLHQSLYKLSIKKTDIVKKGDMSALNQILMDEQSHIAAITKFENERQKYAEAILPNMKTPTISDCLNVIDDENKKTLEQLRTELFEIVLLIKEKNDLNQQLIYQSLQFVNLSLSLVAPQPENYNYGPSAGKPNTSGMFNSKA